MKPWIFLLLIVPAFSLADGTTPKEKILGLVEIPKIFGETDPNGPPGQVRPKVKSINLYAQPDKSSRITATASTDEEIVSNEFEYEASGAVVYDQKQKWYRIRTKSATGWLAPEDAGKFYPYEKLIKKGLSYLDPKNWDGRLYSTADFKTFEQLSIPKSHDQPNTDVEILSMKTAANRVWLQVQIVKGRCEGSTIKGKTGWVPAYNGKGQTNFWFYSRGC